MKVRADPQKEGAMALKDNGEHTITREEYYEQHKMPAPPFPSFNERRRRQAARQS